MNKRIKAILEVIICLSGIMIYIWTLYAPEHLDMLIRNRVLFVASSGLALLYIAYISPSIIFKDTLASRGLGNWKSLFIRTDNFKLALRGYGSLTLFGSFVILGYTFTLQPANIIHINWAAFFVKLIFYLSSALIQQLLFVGWLLVRLRSIICEDNDNSILSKQFIICFIAATIVSFIHSPNLPIMIISFIGGFAVIWVSYKTPNLFLAVISHAILGTMLFIIAGVQVKLGPHYLQKDFHFSRTLFPVFKKIIGNLF